MGEYIMKPLLTQWVTQWIEDPRLKGWILASWAVVTKELNGPELPNMPEDLVEDDEEMDLGPPQDSNALDLAQDMVDEEEEIDSRDLDVSTQLATDEVLARTMALGLRRRA